MPAKVAGNNTEKNNRQDNSFVMSHVPLAALVLLFCRTSVLVSDERDTGPVVRQEAPFPTIIDPDVTRSAHLHYEVLRGDFHMHTLHSDGTLSPANRVLEAWQYGYDVIAITDHGNFNAYAEALPTAEALDIVLLRGMETGLSGQEHLIAFGFSADYEPRNPHQWAETDRQAQVFYRHQWQRLAAAGGFVLYAHPHVGLREPMLWGIDQGLLQGIEVKNDVVGAEWNTVDSHGTYWYPFALTWAAEHNLTIFANSDVHGSRGGAEQAVTLVLATDRSQEAVMEALHAGRTAARFNNMLCAHEWVLRLLMASLVDVHPQRLPDGRSFLRLQNHGPLELTAEITGTPLEPVTLGPYQNLLAGVRRLPNTVTINWQNLYIYPTQNLATTHTLTALPK
ncbi:MAG: PHP domain-containing protein [Planctomycetota bacterium]|jgi:predicted metal-dependent phosphoesterase TrpH